MTASVKAIRGGKLMCEEAPHATSVGMMRLMDTIRKQTGTVYAADV